MMFLNISGGPRCPRSGAEHRLKAIYGLIKATEVQVDQFVHDGQALLVRFLRPE